MRKGLNVLLPVVALVSTSCSETSVSPSVNPSIEPSVNPSIEPSVNPSVEPSINEYEPKIYERSGKILYGLYPQTVVNDVITILELNELTTTESNGWYLYKDEYYSKITADPYIGIGYVKNNCKFDNCQVIESGVTYWFKCEPIVWNILTGSNGEYFLLSNKLLDVHCYYTSTSDRTVDGTTVYANNYEYSDIRAWLNGYDGSGYEVENYSGKGFLDTAFALNSSYIKTTEVDNSAATTDDPITNPYACENTQDKVFLPSYQDYRNTEYGFPTSTGASTIRQAKTTDYARAKGAYVEDNDYGHNSMYYTRSPDNSSSEAWGVNLYGQYDPRFFYGHLNCGSVSYSSCSVRPSISLQIS